MRDFIKYILSKGGRDVIIARNRITGWFDIEIDLFDKDLLFTVTDSSGELYEVVNEEYQARQTRIKDKA